MLWCKAKAFSNTLSLKNIIIFSEETDHTTTTVLKGLFAFDKSVSRINIDDPLLNIKSIETYQVVLQTSFGEVEIFVNDIIWFRRISLKHTFFFDNNEEEFELAFKKFRANESVSIYHSMIHWLVQNCNCIGNPYNFNLNKIEQLIVAKKMGLRSPDWLITDSKSCLKKFIKKHKAIVKKDFSQFNYIKDGSGYKNLTRLLSYLNLDEFDSEFNPTFFQEYIRKKYEIRVFQWMNKFYPMAIFSQNDETTKIDFRNYNVKSPNRCVPIKLPSGYQDLLINFSKKVKVDHGSYDILVDNDDRLHFLELNPIGQFEMISGPCNYYIERDIAQYLNDLTKTKYELKEL